MHQYLVLYVARDFANISVDHDDNCIILVAWTV